MPEKLTVNKTKKGKRKHGFLSRNASTNGKKVIKRQRAKGRKQM